jgi:serine phosphatase RsbU (regulator of sigma subunit)/anti-sigma regulatory factor (Ser/Thr protein kinase)
VTPTIATVPGCSLRLDSPCDLDAVREATRQLRQFLLQQGVSDLEVSGWELVSMEAATNAVEHVRPDALDRPVRLTAFVTTGDVEVTIQDQTPGFDWPDQFALPDDESESGRGLYLIKTFCSEANYLRSRDGNVLTMRRQRLAEGERTSEEALRQQILELETVLGQMTEQIAGNFESLSAIFRLTENLNRDTATANNISGWLADFMPATGAEWYTFRLVNGPQTHLDFMAASEAGLTLPPLSVPRDGSEPTSIEAQAVLCRSDVWFEPDTVPFLNEPLARQLKGSIGIVHPIFVQNQLVGVLTAGRSISEGAFLAEQINTIHTIVDFVAIQCRNARLQEDHVRGRLVNRELEIAATIQRSLLPEKLTNPPGYAVAGYSESASKVGGDFYDLIPVDDTSALLVIADVMGKGVPAAMFAAIFRSCVLACRKELAQFPGEVMTWLNQTLFADLDRVEMFVTAQLVYLDWNKRELRVAAAGHCPAMLCAPGQPLIEIDADGPPLGVSPHPRYETKIVEMPAGARLLMFTDGLLDSRNAADEQFGLDATRQWLREVTEAGLDPETARRVLIQRVKEFQGERVAFDDITLLLLADQPTTVAQTA